MESAFFFSEDFGEGEGEALAEDFDGDFFEGVGDGEGLEADLPFTEGVLTGDAAGEAESSS